MTGTETRSTAEYLRLLGRVFEARTERFGATFRHRVLGGRRWLVASSGAENVEKGGRVPPGVIAPPKATPTIPGVPAGSGAAIRRVRYRALSKHEIVAVAACERCGSLVAPADGETHAHWHELVEGAWRD